MLHRKEILTKVTTSVNRKKILSFALLILSLSGSFGFGVIIGAHIIARPPLIINKQLIIPTLPSTTIQLDSYLFVASKRGKYYYPINCSLAQQLSKQNKVYFKSKKEAEAKGYQFNQKCQ